jgi:hypothetical protein
MTTVRVDAWQYGSARITNYVDLAVQDCCNCGVTFALTKELDDQRRKDHGTFYCPNGHPQVYTGKTEAQKLREELAQAQAQLVTEKKRTEYAHASRKAAQDQAAAAERSAAAYKGHLTRMRNRVANGVCPVQGCQRPFVNVHDHILNKHPEWAVEHPEVLA